MSSTRQITNRLLSNDSIVQALHTYRKIYRRSYKTSRISVQTLSVATILRKSARPWIWNFSSNGLCLISKSPHSSRSHALVRSWMQHCLYSDLRSLPPSLDDDSSQLGDTILTQKYAHLHQQALAGKYLIVQSATEKIVKDHGEPPNSRLYVALLLANAECSNGSANEVAGILSNMVDDGVEPTSAIIHAALQALAIHCDYLLRSYILHELRQRWFSLNHSGWHNLVAGLMRDRQFEKALDAFEQMQKAGVTVKPWLYDTVIYTLCSAEEFDEAFKLLECRLDSGEMPISPTLWAHVLDTASRALHYPLTLLAFNARIQTSYLNPSSGVCANILSTAARHNDTYLATCTTQLLSPRTGNPVQLHHYEALLESYVSCGDLQSAFSLLASMGKAGKLPTEDSVRSLFVYLSQCHRYPYRAHKIAYSMRGKGRNIPIQAINVLIEAYVYHRQLPTAIELYKSMETLSTELSPNIATFNNLLKGCVFHKRKDVAMFLARDMVDLNIKPNSLTYDRLLLVCLNTDEGLETSWRYFNEMKAAGWRPRSGTAVTLAKRACAFGDQRVWDLVEEENSRGLQYDKVKALVKEHWCSGKEALKRRLSRTAIGNPPENVTS